MSYYIDPIFWRARYVVPLPPGIKVISTTAGPMISLEKLRQQCELVAIDGDSDADSHPDDELLIAYLDAAIEHAEDFTGLAIALRTYEMALDSFPWSSAWTSRGIELPRPPLIRIDSFFATAAGSEGELDEGDDYLVDDYRTPARIVPVTSWPSMTRATNALKIRFTAGYMTPAYEEASDFSASDYAGAQQLPAAIRQALLLMVRHFWEHRSDSVDKTLATIPNGFKDLLRPKKVILGMA